MKLDLTRTPRAFTLVEILLAMAIFAMVLTAMYSSWTSVLRASKAGATAAEAAQRERAAMRLMQDAFVSAQMFLANRDYYAFSAIRDGQFSGASFVSRLPESFPRGSRFGGMAIRRVAITVESAREGGNRLVMRQNPIFMDLEEDEQAFPIILAKDVRVFELTFWDQRKADWVDDWVYTNQLPKLVRIALATGDGHPQHRTTAGDVVTRIVNIPSIAVPTALQLPGGAGTLNPGALTNSPGNQSVPPTSINGNPPTIAPGSTPIYRAPSPVIRGRSSGG